MIFAKPGSEAGDPIEEYVPVTAAQLALGVLVIKPTPYATIKQMFIKNGITPHDA